MSLLARIDADADRLVRGLPPAGDDPELAELAGFVAELRAAHQQSPAEEVRDRHLKAIDEAVRTRDGSAVAAGRKHARVSTWITPARRGRAMAFRLAAIGLAAAIGVGGLAAAGVSPSGPVEAALERIGIKSDSGDDEEGPEATEEASPPGGDAREDAARNRPTGNQARRRARDGDRKAGARGRGDERRSETGTARSGPGRATAEEAAGGGTPPSSPGRSDAHRRDGSGSQPSPGKGGGKGSAGGGTGQGQGIEQGSSQSQGKADAGLDRADEAHQNAGSKKG